VGTTPVYAIPYVEPGDALANFPTQDKAKADRLEALFGARMISSTYHLTSGNQSIPAATDTVINFNSPGPAVDAVNLPYSGGVWTVKQAGLYLLLASLFYEKASSGSPRIYTAWQLNGTTFAQQIDVAETANYQTLPITALKVLAVNDQVRIIGRSDIAITINANSGGFQTSASVLRLSA
jgi:hypothetical protein